MGFNIGETVVYPHHGAAIIEEVEHRIIKGKKREYFVLRVLQGELVVRVPSDKVKDIGIRDVVSVRGVKRVLDVLQQDLSDDKVNWSRRYKINLEKLASGDIMKIAEVVRDLHRRNIGKGLSTGEKRMLFKARQVLIGELALAKKFDEEQAGELIDDALAS